MVELYNLNLNEVDIKNIIETNPDIKDVSKGEILKRIYILKQINCNDKIIKNIIISNPFYLNKSEEDIIKLIHKLTSIGLKNLDLLFDSNPDLLNKDAFEIDDFIMKKRKEYSLAEIVDMIDSNPYIIDEE